MSVVILGGTGGIGRVLAASYTARGHDVVVAGRDEARAVEIAAGIGPSVRGMAVDLADPHGVKAALADLGPVSRLVLAGIDRDSNSVAAYDIDGAINLVNLKLVGYTVAVHALADRFTPDASALLFGGIARLRPYPGSTTVTAVNAGVIGMVRTLSLELAPIRFNSIHPGIVGDSPYWAGKALDAVAAGTLTGKLATMDQIVDACVFLLENPAVNGVDLNVDGGWR